MFSKLKRLMSLPREAYYSLSGWRFNDIKKEILELNKLNSGMVQSYDTSNGSVDYHHRVNGARIAMIGLLPPFKTGIAAYNAELLKLVRFPIDFYVPIIESKFYLLWKNRIETQSNGSVKILPISLFLASHDFAAYEKAVFIVGNSSDHRHVVKECEDFCREFNPSLAHVYLHDVSIHNATSAALAGTLDDYVQHIHRLYRGADGGNSKRNANVPPKFAFDALINSAMLGPRLFKAMGVEHYFVNSSSAVSLLRSDLNDEAEITQLYLPVLDAKHSIPLPYQGLGSWRRGGKPLIIGCFGYPGVEKASEVVIEAVRMLRGKGINVCLRMVGYQAEQYIQQHTSQNERVWAFGYEAPTQSVFEGEALKCDIAIQLRRQNLGESSGVIPIMLRYNIPVITNGSSSLGEYGDSVFYIDDVSAIGVAAKIEALRASELERQLDFSYRDRHDSRRFAAELEAVLFNRGDDGQ